VAVATPPPPPRPRRPPARGSPPARRGCCCSGRSSSSRSAASSTSSSSWRWGPTCSATPSSRCRSSWPRSCRAWARLPRGQAAPALPAHGVPRRGGLHRAARGLSALALYAAFAWLDLYQPAMLVMAAGIGLLVGCEIPLLMGLLQRIRRAEAGQSVADLLAADYLGAVVAGGRFPLPALPALGQIDAALAVGRLNLVAGGRSCGSWGPSSRGAPAAAPGGPGRHGGAPRGGRAPGVLLRGSPPARRSTTTRSCSPSGPRTRRSS
jgi:hypothetical protein